MHRGVAVFLFYQHFNYSRENIRYPPTHNVSALFDLNIMSYLAEDRSIELLYYSNLHRKLRTDFDIKAYDTILLCRSIICMS